MHPMQPHAPHAPHHPTGRRFFNAVFHLRHGWSRQGMMRAHRSGTRGARVADDRRRRRGSSVWAYNRWRWVAFCIRGCWCMPTGGSWPIVEMGGGVVRALRMARSDAAGGAGWRDLTGKLVFPGPVVLWRSSAPPARGTAACPATTVGVPVASLSAPAARPGHAMPDAGAACGVDAVPIPLLQGTGAGAGGAAGGGVRPGAARRSRWTTASWRSRAGTATWCG